MKDDLRSAWVYFVRPGLNLLQAQGFATNQAVRAAVLAAGYMISGYRQRVEHGNNYRVGFWRMTFGQVSGVMRDPRFSSAGERLSSVLALPYDRALTLHVAVGHNDYLAPAFAAFHLLAGPASVTGPNPISLLRPAAQLRAVYIDDRWPGAWKDGVWLEATDVVLNG